MTRQKWGWRKRDKGGKTPTHSWGKRCKERAPIGAREAQKRKWARAKGDVKGGAEKKGPNPGLWGVHSVGALKGAEK